MKKFANKEWYTVEEEKNEFVFYHYCKSPWFRFIEKEITSYDFNDKIEKYEIEKILYNEKNKSLEIFSLIQGVHQKVTIKENSFSIVDIDFIYYVEYVGDTSVKRKILAANKRGLKNIRRIENCAQNTSNKRKKYDASDEPPAPPK
ncbi:MAG: hypothetical protein EOO44_14220 [Flavobacterium sp.]|nr:MAG: hypothetical protein EOO44_14220 [Flavobacterium sp.]